MSHNPDKSKALCVIAKATYFSMAALGWILLTLLLCAALACIGFRLYIADWSTLPARVWNEVAHPTLILLMFITSLCGGAWATDIIFQRVKRYAKDC